jgi:hypothetical protein
MPRLTQEVPKYRKHRASHQAIVEINGRRHYLGPWQSKASRIEYDRLITEWLSSGRSKTFGKPEHVITITELIVAYLEYAKGYYGDKPRSEFTNMRDALRPVRRLYGPQPAREFGPLQLKAVREQILATGNARTHINTKIGKIVRVFRWGVSEGLLPIVLKLAGLISLLKNSECGDVVSAISALTFGWWFFLGRWIGEELGDLGFLSEP